MKCQQKSDNLVIIAAKQTYIHVCSDSDNDAFIHDQIFDMLPRHTGRDDKRYECDDKQAVPVSSDITEASYITAHRFTTHV